MRPPAGIACAILRHTAKRSALRAVTKNAETARMLRLKRLAGLERQAADRGDNISRDQ
jgi:hypothetical protein